MVFRIVLFRLALGAGFILISQSISAQLFWKKVNNLYPSLSEGLNIYESSDSIDGKPNRSFYIEADLKNKNLHFTTRTLQGKRQTPAEFYNTENKPLLVVNGTFFAFETNRNLNITMRDEKIQSYNIPVVKGKKDSLFSYITRSAIGIDKHRKADVAWIYSDSAKRFPLALQNKPSTLKGSNSNPGWKEMKKSLKKQGVNIHKWKMETAIGGGPNLIHNQQILITNLEERMFIGGEADRHPRTAMGYTKDGKLIILMVEGRNPGKAEGMTLAQEAKTLLDLGCVEALNLDGGGSSCMLINGKETIKPSDKEGQRPVPAVFMIYRK